LSNLKPLTVREIRHKNFMYLANQYNGRAEFAEKLGYDNPNYINQIAAEHLGIGHKTAKRIEEAEGLPAGWMSRPNYEEWGVTASTPPSSLLPVSSLVRELSAKYDAGGMSNNHMADLLTDVAELLHKISNELRNNK